MTHVLGKGGNQTSGRREVGAPIGPGAAAVADVSAAAGFSAVEVATNVTNRSILVPKRVCGTRIERLVTQIPVSMHGRL
jgi:hypothetical protein